MIPDSIFLFSTQLGQRRSTLKRAFGYCLLNLALIAFLSCAPPSQLFSPPVDHTEELGSPDCFTALHKIGYEDPFSNDCDTCHGTTLDGDMGPSCFTCHGEKWGTTPADGPPGSHTVGDTNLHAPGRENPLGNGCNLCHGTDLTGCPDVTPSCYMCHNAVWNLENEAPIANPNGPYTGTVGIPLQLDGSGSSDPDGTIYSHDWDYGDSTTGSGEASTHTYAAAGTYTVTLTVTDDDGATNTASTTATIESSDNTPPVADPNGPYTGTVGIPLQLDGSGSSDPDGTIYSHDWDYGDSTTGSGEASTHTYAAAGTYTVTLTVTDDDGATNTASTTATIEEFVNEPPDCSSALPSVDTLWPPNHKFQHVEILGVTDPEDDPVTITITDIAQDEPVNGKGDGNTCPDGSGVDTDTAELLAERAGKGNGRVYTLSFTTHDDQGGECTGTVTVSVPHDKRGDQAVDDGPTYSSTLCDQDD